MAYNPRNIGLSRLPAVMAFCLSGCLYSTHHFNSGRILEPGETAVTFGLGQAHFYGEECPEGFYLGDPDASGVVACRRGFIGVGGSEVVDPAETEDLRPVRRVRQTLPKASFGYRLGVRREWGPFTGLEIGWGLEVPTNPASLEFDLKAGLPVPRAWKISHSLSAGWGVGIWIDNTWFAEYAVSRAFGRQALFAGYRFSYLATQPDDLDSSLEAGRFVRVPNAAHQFALGWFQKLPTVPVLPDYAIPEITLTLPVFPGELRAVRPPAFDLNFNMAIGWNF